jgi:uncharacterized membrane protein YraQ (UPF0718 family)
MSGHIDSIERSIRGFGLIDTMPYMIASASQPARPLIRRSRNLEVSIVIALAIGIVGAFWGIQRYPALLKKLHTGNALHIGGAISFDALLPVNPAMPLPLRALRTGVNWIYTNRFGMYFALPFGAAMMTLLAQTTGSRQFKHAAANVICGAVAGAPLGVCTNCATPVAQSLLAGGASTRMTVAAMISSPSFNPVVLAMAFVLFPARLAVFRVMVPALLLAMLPLFVREREPQRLGMTMPDEAVSPGARAAALAKTFLRSLLRLTLMTLPWMLLAALLGGFAAEAIPAYATHLPLLPVPMAFDVGLAWVLYRSGVPAPYVAALLCTLGPVSIYSLTALGQQLGRSVPLKMAAATACLGSVAGVLTILRG